MRQENVPAASLSDAPAASDGNAVRQRAFDELFTERGRAAEGRAQCIAPPPLKPRPILLAENLEPARPRLREPARFAIDDDRSAGQWRDRLASLILLGAVVLIAAILARAIPATWRATASGASSRESAATRVGDSGRRSLRTVDIEDVRLGDRLVGQNPLREQAEAVEPNPANWREVRLSLTTEDGLGVWVRLLRPPEWLAEYDIVEGGEVFVDLFEMGVEGDAEVTYVGPCPAIKPGTGTVVTGTFKHQAEPGTRVVHLRLEGQAEPTGVTDNHPYWSADRQEFVTVGELRIGERVDTVDGPRRVVSVTPLAEVDFLYNLETTEHVFRVGSRGTLVHNTCGVARKFDGPIHHIATDKGTFSANFRRLFDRAGLDMQSSWNRMRLQGHVGPHGEFYHRLVFDRLDRAVGTRSGQSARTALIDELKSLRRDIRYGGLDALLKAVAPQVDVRGNF